MNTFKVLIITLFLLTACETEKVIEGTDLPINIVAFKPNQCAELWDETKYTTNSKLTREERMLAFLKDNGITDVTELLVTKDSNIYCAACTCPSNDNIKFKVSNASLEKLKTISPFKLVLK